MSYKRFLDCKVFLRYDFFIPRAVMLLWCGSLVNGPYALITTAVSADLVRPEPMSVGPWFRDAILNMSRAVSTVQGTHESLRGNSRALSTVTAIIDGTGSIGVHALNAGVAIIPRHLLKHKDDGDVSLQVLLWAPCWQVSSLPLDGTTFSTCWSPQMS